MLGATWFQACVFTHMCLLSVERLKSMPRLVMFFHLFPDELSSGRINYKGQATA